MAKKRKVSAYNRHVGREMKAGKTMKQAAASWKGGGSTKVKRSSGGTRKVAKRKTKSTKRGSRLLGNIGIKGMLSGGAMLFAAQSLLPSVGGAYAPAVQKIAAGVGAKAIGVSGAALTGAGLMEAGSMLIRGLLSGNIALPSVGGGGNGGGYDY